MKHPVAVAISGGIDSLYSAHLLKSQGYDVTGIHFITGYASFAAADTRGDEATHPLVNVHGSADPSTCSAMAMIATQLDVPIHIVDLSEIFESQVVSYFTEAYQKGLTPNPCLRCNPTIKFGALLDVAHTLGIERIATGHYVRSQRDDSKCMHLFKGEDISKDQAYFLAFLNQDQLKNALFPLGNTSKKTIRQKAEQLGLKPVSSKESQDICFIPGDYKAFLAKRPGFKSSPGPIKTQNGEVIGTHQGLHSFTIGQRRGINCPAPFPYYVLGLEMNTNTLIVGPKDTLLSHECIVKKPNWINRPKTFPATLTTRIRYSHKGALSTLHLVDHETIRVEFHEPVSSVTPGQGAVFYHDDEVLGGGWIT